MSDERRQSPRKPVNFPMMCSMGQEESQAVSRNISKHGVLMATAAKLEMGAQVTVVIRAGNAGAPRRVPGRIVRLVEQDGEPLIAVAFDEPIEDIEALIAQDA